ncbi:MAG TPA: RES domain-containing protein [Candidatus Limnocylindria bacterium]|nr:RES domain-containing protein [Candidatus Limnocylindria bacterium]
MIVYRHADPRFPFVWESADQPPARWHATGGGPVQYFSSTPDAAWAEFLRHEEINEPDDLAGINRALWSVELDPAGLGRPRLPASVMIGDESTYAACRAAAERLRGRGSAGLVAPSAAVERRVGSGLRTDRGLRRGPARAEFVVALFGRRPDLVGWSACAEGRPRADLLPRVRHFGSQR